MIFRTGYHFVRQRTHLINALTTHLAEYGSLRPIPVTWPSFGWREVKIGRDSDPTCPVVALNTGLKLGRVAKKLPRQAPAGQLRPFSSG
ncbi:MAG: hypothetical protein E5X44_33815, partial [Mesorhizobium sp.]